MDDRTEARILEKARYIVDAIEMLAERRDELSFEEYEDSRTDRDIVEREFETAIEAAIDIGTMLLRVSESPVPDTNAEIFHKLERLGVLDSTTATRMAEAAGFRNILAHRYGAEIDNEDVFNALQEDLPVFRDFLAQVRGELE